MGTRLRGVKLMRKVLNHITKHPKMWDQRVCYMNECLTKFCFAGMAVFLVDGVGKHNTKDPDCISTRAEKLLGIHGQRHTLFASDNTLETIRAFVEQKEAEANVTGS